MTKTQNGFSKIFTVIPDSKSKIKSSSYQKSGKYAVVDQGKELIAGYTDSPPTVDQNSLPVIVFGDHTRAVKYINFPFTAGADGTQILKPSALTNPKYAFYLVLNAVVQIPSKGYARHFGELKNMLFEVPSLDKQHDIVVKLDKAFAEIDSLEKNLQSKEENTNQLLQSMLSAAFNYSNDSDMNFVKIGEVCNLMTGGTPSRSKSEFFTNGTIKWLVSGDIKMREIFNCPGRITSAAMQSSNTKILPLNSVMIALNGQGKTRGTVAMLRTEATCNQSLVSIFPKDLKILIPEFIFYNLNMRYLEIRRITGDDGNDRRGLNMSIIRDIEIPLPPVEIQNNIVNKIIKISSEIEKLKNQSSIEKEKISSLRQSILSHVFNFEEKAA